MRYLIEITELCRKLFPNYLKLNTLLNNPYTKAEITRKIRENLTLKDNKNISTKKNLEGNL